MYLNTNFLCTDGKTNSIQCKKKLNKKNYLD